MPPWENYGIKCESYKLWHTGGREAEVIPRSNGIQSFATEATVKSICQLDSDWRIVYQLDHDATSPCAKFCHYHLLSFQQQGGIKAITMHSCF